MPDLVLRSPSLNPLLMGALNLAIAAYNGWEWSQGRAGTVTKVFTVLPALLVLLSVFQLLRPPEIRLGGGRLQARVAFTLRWATPVENVEFFDFTGEKVRIRFEDLSRVEPGASWKSMMEKSFRGKGIHFELPIKADKEEMERFKEALFGKAGRDVAG